MVDAGRRPVSAGLTRRTGKHEVFELFCCWVVGQFGPEENGEDGGNGFHKRRNGGNGNQRRDRKTGVGLEPTSSFAFVLFVSSFVRFVSSMRGVPYTLAT